MVIKRTFGGVEFKLTLSSDELFDAFEEQQFLFDSEDVKDMLYDIDTLGEYGITTEDALGMVDQMAYEMRRNINKYEMGWREARDEAINQVLSAEQSRREEVTA